MLESVIEVLGTRAHRVPDRFRVALIIEGGGARGMFTAGMCLGLEELGLQDTFDAVYATSAGALNGAWFLSGQAVDKMPLMADENILARVIDPRRMLWGKPIFDTYHLIHEVYDKTWGLDTAAILSHRTTFHPIATNAKTGKPVDLHTKIKDKKTLLHALRAACNIPLLAGAPLKFAGEKYVDGGMSESVPIRTAMIGGATHALVLRTLKDGEIEAPGPWLQQKIGDTYMRWKAPGAYQTWQHKPEINALEERYLVDLGPAVKQVRPPAEALFVDSAERNPEVLTQALEVGRKTVVDLLSGVV